MRNKGLRAHEGCGQGECMCVYQIERAEIHEMKRF